MPRICTPLIGIAALFLVSEAVRADEAVVASIKPIHSLAAGVMAGVGEPAIIVEGAGSPHTFSLRPSQAHELEHAKVIIWVGHQLETFMEEPVETLGRRAVVVELADADGLVRVPLREGGAFEGHDHDDHDDHAKHDDHDDHAKHDDHDDHAKHDDHDDHAGHAEHAAHDDHGDDHDGHGDGDFDIHLWLDPENAKGFVREIESALSSMDPANADRYRENASSLVVRLDELTAELTTALEPVRNRPFIVFHDAYQNFENRFGVTAVGSITVSPENLPGAERIAEIRAKLQAAEAVCVFSEPQFESRMVDVVTEGTSVRTGVLDPLGTGIESGPDLYFTLMRNMARSMKYCLSANG